MRRALLALAALCAAAAAPRANAHEVRPAYLELAQTGDGTFDVLWKVPARGDLRLGLYVRLPETCVELTEPRGMFAGDAWLERWSIRHDGSLEGETISVDGLRTTLTDVIVRIERLDGSTQVARMDPSGPEIVVAAAARPWQVARVYLALGVEHILFGIDHLLFVLALLLLVRGWRRVVGTITAFTVAHSITLALATLGVVHVPGPPVEAAIALSIVFVGMEVVRDRRGRPGLTARAPWIVAFAFGLLHGLGFAGALSEIGLPGHAIPLALLFFNVGVEVGQLVFVLLVAAIAALPRRGRAALEAGRTGRPLAVVASAYAIGAVAMYWVIDRVAGF